VATPHWVPTPARGNQRQQAREIAQLVNTASNVKGILPRKLVYDFPVSRREKPTSFSLGAQASVAWVKWTFQRLDDCYYVNESDWGTVLLPFLVSLFLPVWGCSALGKRQAVCTKAAF
jgi:hypothetical protein